MPPPPPPPVHGVSGGRSTGAYELCSLGGHSSGSPSANAVSLKREHKRKPRKWKEKGRMREDDDSNNSDDGGNNNLMSER